MTTVEPTPLFLSRLLLNPRSHQVQSELRDPYQMHRTLSRAFGDGDGGFAAARCLFRIDEIPDSPNWQVLVQSRVKPNWQPLEQVTHYFTAPPQTKEFQIRLDSGQRLAFRLHANPTVKRSGKRLGLYKEEEQLEWLTRKAQANGFELLNATARPAKLFKSHTSSGSETRHLGVIFNGILKVTDAAALALAVESGIGSAKGFGFGLISLARI